VFLRQRPPPRQKSPMPQMRQHKARLSKELNVQDEEQGVDPAALRNEVNQRKNRLAMICRPEQHQCKDEPRRRGGHRRSAGGLMKPTDFQECGFPTAQSDATARSSRFRFILSWAWSLTAHDCRPHPPTPWSSARTNTRSLPRWRSRCRRQASAPVVRLSSEGPKTDFHRDTARSRNIPLVREFASRQRFGGEEEEPAGVREVWKGHRWHAQVSGDRAQTILVQIWKTNKPQPRHSPSAREESDGKASKGPA